MKFQCFTENLSQALSSISRIPNTRTTLPVLSCVLLRAENATVTIKATDLEIGGSVVAGAKVDEDGECAVPAKTLLDLVGTLPQGEDVSFSYDSKTATLHVKAQKSKSQIKGIDPQEFPLLDLQEGENTVTLPIETLRQLVKRVAFAVATDESRPTLTGIYLKSEGTQFVAEGADGFRLSRQVMELPTEWAVDAIIPARAFQEFLRECRDSEVKLSINDKQAVFRGLFASLVSQRIEGNYPDVNAIIPQSHTTRVVISTASLLQAVKTVMVFGREVADSLRLNFKDNHVTVSATSAEIGMGECEVGCTITGANIEIAVNGKFLEDALAVLGENTVFEFTTPSSPIAIKSAGDDSFIHVIMPMHLGR